MAKRGGEVQKRAEYLGPEKRRPMVLDAAQAIFAEGGFSDASMSAIAARAGVSKAVLYDCFPGGKQEIYYALLDRGEQVFLDHMLAVLDHTTRLPLEESLREGFAAFMNYAEINPLGFRIIFGEPGTSDPEIARRARHTKQLMVDKMGMRTRNIMSEAGLPITDIVDLYNHALVAIAEEMAQWTLQNPALPKHLIVEALVQWLMKGFEQIIPGDHWKKPLPE